MELRYDPHFAAWLQLFIDDEELLDIYADLIALLDALATHGRDLLEPESKPIAASRHLHELRPTPPSTAAPFADQRPVLRILYAFCRTDTGTITAVVLLGGDKTDLGNAWYPANVMRAETRLASMCGRYRLKPLPN